MLVTKSQTTEETTPLVPAVATNRTTQIIAASRRFFENTNLLPSYIYFYKSHQTFGDYSVRADFSMTSVAEYKLIVAEGVSAYFRLLGADYPGFPSKVPVPSSSSVASSSASKEPNQMHQAVK